jgi:hypothetical protein
MTEIKYLECCGLFDVKFKSGSQTILDEQDMLTLGFDILAINYAKYCPNIFVTISQI